MTALNDSSHESAAAASKSTASRSSSNRRRARDPLDPVVLASTGELLGFVEDATYEGALGAAISLAARSGREPGRLGRRQRSPGRETRRVGCASSFVLYPFAISLTGHLWSGSGTNVRPPAKRCSPESAVFLSDPIHTLTSQPPGTLARHVEQSGVCCSDHVSSTRFQLSVFRFIMMRMLARRHLRCYIGSYLEVLWLGSETVASLREAVESNGGVLSLDVQHVRDACGVRRIREINVERIRAELADVGLACYPSLRGRKQGDIVRLYTRTSAVGRFALAFLKPSRDNDTKLRELSGKALETLERIRTLCDED